MHALPLVIVTSIGQPIRARDFDALHPDWLLMVEDTAICRRQFKVRCGLYAGQVKKK